MSDFTQTIRTFAPEVGVSTPAEDLRAIAELIDVIAKHMQPFITQDEGPHPFDLIVANAVRITEAMAVWAEKGNEE